MRATPNLLACMFFVLAPAAAQLPVEPHPNPRALLESTDAALAANKRLVFDFWRTVVAARHIERAADYLAENYVEHDPSVPEGRAGLLERVGRAPPSPVVETIPELVAIVAERDLVVLAFRRELFDLANEGQTYTTTWFEMFRVADGKIAERWNFGPED
jgi:predicted SnoaL-like aldol condensation-catalyzing enzyme